jgi:hypothetical protein
MAKLHHEALIYTMVLASAADREMSDPELRSIGDMVRSLPIFLDLDEMEISIISGACAEMLNDEDGLEAVLDFINDALPEKLRETAYALACDIVAADLAGQPGRTAAAGDAAPPPATRPADRRRHRTRQPRPPYGGVTGLRRRPAL